MQGKIYIECTCIQKKNTGIARTITSLIETLRDCGFNVIEICHEKQLSFFEELVYYNYQLPVRCNKMMKDNDIFLIPNNMGKFWRLPYKNTWILMHDVIPLTKYGRYSFLKKQLYLFKTSKINKATRIITISEYVKKNLVDFLGVPPERIKVLYWSIFTPPLFHKVDGVDPYFVSIGTGEFRKNIDFLIENWPYVYDKKFRLKLFGKEWKQGAHSELKDKIKKLGMQDFIEILGPISDEEMNNLYTHAVGLIFPSLEEGFGLPPLEALRCGCSVVLPKTPINYELYGGIGYFYSIGDKDELSNCINQIVLNGKEDRKRNIKYTEKFSEENFKNRVFSLFKI